MPENIMNARLLIIDPQNDFCDIPGAALPVAGAAADMQRLANFIYRARQRVADITVTLDSHASVGIERTTFWIDAAGGPVAPFTQITATEVRSGSYRTRDAAQADEALAYLDALERLGRYRLVVWPVHCVLGTWGHNIHDAVAVELARWELDTQRPAFRVLKGLNPMTEQYSAVQAEVPVANDPHTQTNRALIERAKPGSELLLVAGEASSHCVAATMEHLFAALGAQECARVVILADCMSPVPGFEAQAQKFFDFARTRGAHVLTTDQALAVLA
jgi:nicotinamidase-related amidase